MPPNAVRLSFLDVLRGLAVVWMIETHVFDVGLAPALKSGWFARGVYFTNGYVAVVFAFCAGAAFWLIAEASGPSRVSWRYLRRLGFLFLAGLWLNTYVNMGLFSLRRFLDATPRDRQWIWQFDILQLIAASLVLASLLHLAVGRLKGRPYFYLIGALAVFLATPAVWASRLGESLPPPVAMAFLPVPLSKFPLFPWAGYVLAGAGFMGLLARSARPKRLAAALACVSFLTPFVTFYVKDLAFAYPGMEGFGGNWYPSPGHSIFRVAGAVLPFGLLFLAEPWLKENPVARFLKLNGRESLWMFLSHVVLVFGSGWTLGLSDLAPGRLGPLETLLGTVLVTAACFAPAVAWHHYKKAQPRRAFAILALTVAVWAVLFLLTPPDMGVAGVAFGGSSR